MRATVGSLLPWLCLRRAIAVCAVLLFIGFCSCTGTVSPGDGTTDNSSSGGSTDGNNDNTSVGGVVVDDDVFGPPSGSGDPTLDLLRARIRNESPSRADVTVRFIEGDAIVHLAFIRALPTTVTTVTSPQMSEEIEISGVDQTGRALGDLRYELGVDYDKYRPAEYIIAAGTGGSDPPPDDEEPGHPVPVSITMLAPAQDEEVFLGSTLIAKWSDEGGAEGAVVRLFLSPAGGPASGAGAKAVGPAIGASLDGLNDQLAIVIEDVEPGEYAVVAEISDGFTTDTAVAAGRVVVMADPANIAPLIGIRVPSQLVEVDLRGLLSVEWADEDPDDNATITFALESVDSGGVSLGRFPISPPLAEDPDGPAFDRAAFPVGGVLPGVYDLVATIDDGDLTGTARVAQSVRIRPDVVNDAPSIQLIEPSAGIEVPLNGSFTVRWIDTDANDNARISLLLDPDPGMLSIDGNEIVMVGSLGEDADGDGDSVTLGVPAGAVVGVYRVVGVISDGQAEVVAAAPGLVTLTEVEPNRDPGGDPQPLRSIQLVSSATDVRLRMGETIPLRVEYSNLPSTALPRLYLSSTNKEGESLRVEITPPNAQPNAELIVALPSSTEVIPNKWWPRRFRLEAEVNVDGTRYFDAAKGAVWIRQEVELLSVQMVNYWCWDENLAELESTDFFGMEIQWYGGGFEENTGGPVGAVRDASSPSPVRFWASLDGAVPDDIKGDSRHRMMKQVLESPNVVQKLRLDYATMIGLNSIAGGGNDPIPIGSALESGLYSIVATAETQAFGRLLSPVAGPVEMCFPIPASRKPPEP